MIAQIIPGTFRGNLPVMVIDISTGAQIKAASCQRWAGDMTCWAVVDASGIRRIFKADGRHAFGGPYIIVNYREVKP